MGVIAFRPSSRGIEYLMIRRKDTLGYVDFMRGKYSLHNLEYLRNIIDEMTMEEKRKLLTMDFDELWRGLWGDSMGIQYRSEERSSRDKFETLKAGVSTARCTYTLASLVEASETTWEETEWGFPKGRRNYQEKDMAAALREFEEETGYSRAQLRLVQNLLPFEEIFTGSNYKSYKHRYFVGMVDPPGHVHDFQRSEVSKLEWKTVDEALAAIRPYNLEKKEVLTRVAEVLHGYRLYP
jgi:8-oxo-dGTP pyrophosphatase MutT (NUDIX family)